MEMYRRTFLKAAIGAAAAVGLATVTKPREAHAWAFLEGVWLVRCPDGHDNMIAGLTRTHQCEAFVAPGQRCGRMSVSEGSAFVVCPRNRNHVDVVDGITRQHECECCGAQMRRG